MILIFSLSGNDSKYSQEKLAICSEYFWFITTCAALCSRVLGRLTQIDQNQLKTLQWTVTFKFGLIEGHSFDSKSLGLGRPAPLQMHRPWSLPSRISLSSTEISWCHCNWTVWQGPATDSLHAVRHRACPNPGTDLRELAKRASGSQAR